jgi:tetratricopeptide (TPR) repeat protein
VTNLHPHQLFYYLTIFTLSFILSCKSKEAVKPSPASLQQTQQQNITQQTLPFKKNTLLRKQIKFLKNLIEQYKNKYNEINKNFTKCEEQYHKLLNTPCKPEKIIEVKKEKTYISKTINFSKYKKILLKQLPKVRRLTKRKEIAKKLFFIYLSEDNWTKAYDIYQQYLKSEESKENFFNVLLSYIYLNNAEKEKALQIFKTYEEKPSKTDEELTIKLIKFCKKISAIGVYEPKPNVAKKGTTALIYLLLNNVHFNKNNSNFSIRLSIKITMHRYNEKFVLLNEENVVLNYNHQISDVLVPIRLQIPLKLSYNYYFMTFTIKDINKNSMAKKTLKVKIID